MQEVKTQSDVFEVTHWSFIVDCRDLVGDPFPISLTMLYLNSLSELISTCHLISHNPYHSDRWRVWGGFERQLEKNAGAIDKLRSGKESRIVLGLLSLKNTSVVFQVGANHCKVSCKAGS